MIGDPLVMTDPEMQETLTGMVQRGILRGWQRTGGRYVVAYTEVSDPEDDEPVEPTAVMTGPQCRAFLCGLDAGMGWVSRVAREVAGTNPEAPR